MAEPALAQELDPVEFARRLEAIPGAQSGTLPAPAPTPEEPPAWGEIKESEEYKSLTFPDQVNLARQWGEETKAYAATLPDYTEDQGRQIDEFVNTEAVEVPANIKRAAAAAGLVKGAASGLGAIAGGVGGLAVGGPVGAIAGGIGGMVAGGELAEAGLQKFVPQVAAARAYAPGYATAGEYAPSIITAGVGAKGLVTSGKALAREIGTRRAAEEIAKTAAVSGAVGGGVGTATRAVLGGEVTPATVAEDVLFGALFAGLASGTRVKGYTRDEALVLNERVKSGKATESEFRDWQGILGEAERTQARGVAGAKRTEVELGGRRVLEKTELVPGEQPKVKPQPTAELPAPRPTVPELPEAGVRGTVRGTQADTAELQRRGVTSEMQETLVNLDEPTPVRQVFSVESQGINRQAIVPMPKTIIPPPRPGPMEGEIIREGAVITPRTQLPTTQRPALPEKAEVVEAPKPAAPAPQAGQPIPRPMGGLQSNIILRVNEPKGIKLGQYKLREGEQFSPIKEVPFDDLGQGQSTINQKLVEKYKKDILSGKPIDPITSKYGDVIDGYHRASALYELGFKKIPVTFVEENERLAISEWKKSYGNIPFPSDTINETSKSYPNFNKQTTIPRPMRVRAGEAGFVSTDLAKILKNYMTSAGALTDDMAETLLASKYNKAQLEYEAKFRLRDFNKALIEETGSSKMSPELNRKVREYINGQSEDVSAIPPKTLEAAKRFRSFLDQGARKIITEPGLLTEKQRATVEANIGSYLSRSYQKFDDPTFTMDRLEAKDKERFARSVDFVKRQFLDRAKQEVDDAVESGRPPIEWLRQINETQSVPRERLMGEVQRIVEEGGSAEARRLGSKMEFRPESYGISKELSGLKTRKDIPEEIRYLMGEYDDPRVGFLKGALKQINLYVDQRTLNKLKEQGFQAGLFYDYPAPNTVEIAPTGSKVMSPLNGVYAAPDVANALKNFDVAFNSTIPGITTFARINSVIKWSKTVGSIRSQARNFIFNIPIQIQNGNFDFLVGRDFGKTTSMIMADYGIGQDTQQTRQLLRRAVGLGVMNNAKFNEMEAIMRDAAIDRGDIQNFVERHFYKAVARPLSKAVDSAAGIKDFFDFMYRTGDNFHKIALWRYRVRALMDGKKMNEADAEIEAADWVNDRFATYEKLGPVLKALRANPFTKNFISWNAERIRNSYHSIKGGIEDMRTPGMEKYGMRTIVGNIIGLTISLGSQAMAAYALNWTYEKIKELNSLAPGYQKSATLLPIGYDPKNKEVTYIDISYSDPFDIIRQPINAFMSEDALDKKLISAIGTFFGDFLGVSIATEVAAGIIKNERADGTQIVNPKASPAAKLKSYAEYAGRVIEPGTISDMRQMYYAIKGEPDPFFGPRAPVPSVGGMASSAAGFRVQKLNVGDELFKKSRSFNSAMGQSTRLLTGELMARGAPSAERLRAGAEEMDQARIDTFKDMRKVYKAALSWGLSESEAMSEMKRGGISRENIAAIASGRVPKYRVGRNMMKELYREMPEDFQRRMEITRELLQEGE